MTYSEFERHLLVAAYLTSQELQKDAVTLEEIYQRFELPNDPRWQRLVLKSFHDDGYSKEQLHTGRLMAHRVWLSAEGVRTAEANMQNREVPPSSPSNRFNAPLDDAEKGPENSITTEDGTPLVTEGGEYIVTEDPGATAFDKSDFDPEFFDTGEPVDSSRWTGLPKSGTLTPEASQRVIDAIRLAEDGLDRSGASNEVRAQALAYIVAIRALAEAPEPPADLIWQMAHRLNSIAGIAGLFIALVGLFR